MLSVIGQRLSGTGSRHVRAAGLFGLCGGFCQLGNCAEATAATSKTMKAFIFTKIAFRDSWQNEDCDLIQNKNDYLYQILISTYWMMDIT